MASTTTTTTIDDEEGDYIGSYIVDWIKQQQGEDQAAPPYFQDLSSSFLGSTIVKQQPTSSRLLFLYLQGLSTHTSSLLLELACDVVKTTTTAHKSYALPIVLFFVPATANDFPMPAQRNDDTENKTSLDAQLLCRIQVRRVTGLTDLLQQLWSLQQPVRAILVEGLDLICSLLRNKEEEEDDDESQDEEVEPSVLQRRVSLAGECCVDKRNGSRQSKCA